MAKTMKQRQRSQIVHILTALARKSQLILLVVVLLLHPLLFGSNTKASAAAAGGTGAIDPYSILSVPKTASQQEITKAYRKAALKFHPDKVKPEERSTAEKKFKEIGNAHDILSDESKRKQYDLYGAQGLDDNFHPGGSGGGGGGGFGGMNMNDIFSGMNNQGNGGGDKRYGSNNGFGGQGHNIDLSDILQGFMGGRRGTGNSGLFGGSGFGGGMGGMGSGMGNMGNMGGMGMDDPMFGQPPQQQQQQQPRYTNQSKPQIQPFYCTLGELSDINGFTKKLKVSLDEEHEKIYTIDVQPGWKDGTKIKFKATKDGNFPPMMFVLRQRKHKYLVRDGDDLIYRCAVTCRQAEKGAKIKIPLPDGELLEIITEPDEITKGYVKNIAGKGMPTKKSGRNKFKGRGDFIVEFRIKEES